MGYDWNFSYLVSYHQAFLRGLLVTAELSVECTVIGTILGFPLGMLLRVRPLSWLLLPVNDMGRAIPVLVLLLFSFFFPYKAILGITPPSSFVCALLALTFSQVVFVADIVRGAMDAVPAGPIHGARALGMREATIWRYITLPHVVRTLLPTFIAFFIGNIKFTSLASVIACEDIVFVAKVAASQRSTYLEAWTLVAGIYIVLVLPLTYAGRRLEHSRWLGRIP